MPVATLCGLGAAILAWVLKSEWLGEGAITKTGGYTDNPRRVLECTYRDSIMELLAGAAILLAAAGVWAFVAGKRWPNRTLYVIVTVLTVAAAGDAYLWASAKIGPSCAERVFPGILNGG